MASALAMVAWYAVSRPSSGNSPASTRGTQVLPPASSWRCTSRSGMSRAPHAKPFSTEGRWQLWHDRSSAANSLLSHSVYVRSMAKPSRSGLETSWHSAHSSDDW